ncbi:hypothetical protein NKR23_g1366 [Pleurostoma richardsiae]|uniref:Uncharacterized protein n=1 Tax=Pleurostoma richardsiae TaxID=41990 RepID=A0AA38S558_9PEZI|nr:hypothetical protein NKR23_g1366 [Pleurostoma richardsiae]
MRLLPLFVATSVAQARVLSSYSGDGQQSREALDDEANPGELANVLHYFSGNAELEEFTSAACGSAKRAEALPLGPKCCPQPPGWGPIPTDDTADGFRGLADLHTAATGAATPPGYTLVAQDLDASVEGISLEGIALLQAYDTTACAAICSANVFCGSFNIYFERDPLLDPSIPYGCPDPDSTTNIKCALWSCPGTTGQATNDGELRGDFEVVIQGSNIYNKVRPATAALFSRNLEALCPPTADQESQEKPTGQ